MKCLKVSIVFLLEVAGPFGNIEKKTAKNHHLKTLGAEGSMKIIVLHILIPAVMAAESFLQLFSGVFANLWFWYSGKFPNFSVNLSKAVSHNSIPRSW